MIIDAKTVSVTLLIIGVASYVGLGAIRSFALSIAQENHDANLAMDMTEEARRTKRERDADAAATAAFARVEPLLPASVVANKGGGMGGAGAAAAAQAAGLALPASAPSSGNSLNVGLAMSKGGEDEEAPGTGASATADI
ncbi:hypothetical protein ACHAWF_008656 [Thalassiosira exigua]